MKKLLLIAAAAAVSVNLSAQETRFGAKAGYSLSTLKFKDGGNSENSDPSHTFYVGALVEHKLSDKFALQGEVLYSPLGGKIEASEGTEEAFVGAKSKIKFGTLMVPVSAKYFITEGLSVSAGASFGFILSAKTKYEVNAGLGLPGLDISIGDDVDIKDQTNTLNIAPFLGAEYALENGLFFDARYNMGVSNLAKDSGDGKLTNSFLQVGVGFKFGGN
ncbi:porin family protein [Chryseobacterium carnipullorum]|uniref:porin family protein n=1 Tax=Chryseobacterium carnipullorum TaxID=1124835 RepID=UPI00091668FD|nr:porin family protein [Chryseobacterium carnipullorum]MDN5423509.1 PorT family protein [Chryseobacterium sp.]SHM98111.1 Outer membrane protein beta-barrel domain-containing protein [Chryseobacterium carnipullorum]HBV16553.1 PorT family protein [Chryseobacterium carnipullorum]